MFRRTRLVASAGFLIAITIGGAYLASGWVPRAALLLGSLAAVGAVSSLGYGIVRSRASTPGRRLAAGGVWVAVWCVGLVLPFAARWGLLRWEVSRLPMPDDPHSISVSIDPVAYDLRPDFTVSIVTPQTYYETREFYRAEFARRGWAYREPDRYGVSFHIPDEALLAGREMTLIYEPTEPIMETAAEGLMIFRRGSRVLAVQVLPPSLRDWNGTPASVRIYPFERKPPYLR